jgi:hypothetical protein
MLDAVHSAVDGVDDLATPGVAVCKQVRVETQERFVAVNRSVDHPRRFDLDPRLVHDHMCLEGLI